MQGNSLRTRTLIAAQWLLLPALVVLPWWRGQALVRPERRLELLNEPTVVRPTYDYPLLISDEQLLAVLTKLQPKLRHEQPKINHVDHALRFWGVEATFSDPDSLSGDEMRRMLTDHRAFASAWGEDERPLLLARNGGFAVRTQQGAATASHVDHTLATLAECGTPLDFPVVAAERTGTLRDVLDQAVVSFNINQHEYEWTALVLALYVRDGRPWYGTAGELIDFNRLAERIMRQRYIQGVCFGNHRLFTLTMLLRIDQEKSLFTAATREAVHTHLAEATSRLVAAQSEEGYWDRNWFDAAADPNDSSMTDPLSRRLLATGHALEWWAMAPADLHPPREVLVRAAQWLVREIDKLDETKLTETYTFLTHVGRALALWRGEMPAAAWERLQGEKSVSNLLPAVRLPRETRHQITSSRIEA